MSTSTTARRTAALVLAAGAMVGAAALPASAVGTHRAAPRSRVVLGEIQYDSPGRDNGSNRSLNGEWVEVTNTTRRAANLDGWTLSDSDGNRYRFDNLRLAGRSSVRVHTGVGNDTRTDVYQDRRSRIWSNRADTATPRNDRGRTVDSESWGRGNHR
ncbi:lamin tail domain-containing protein [Streptomyces sp. NBC_01317]|uniref:lamin tail domain-containing protein n=1 Tax=Streptomyces sp. NBC_01317 TaxID=2903822 RepID=UPI002E119317|nr:lamin tail domain-containing protein [Streptomyces sp. NBC_01317]